MDVAIFQVLRAHAVADPCQADLANILRSAELAFSANRVSSPVRIVPEIAMSGHS